MVLGLITATLILYEYYNANKDITSPIYILGIVMLVFAVIDLLVAFMGGKLFMWDQVMSFVVLAVMIWYTWEIIQAYDDNTPINDTLLYLSWVIVGLVIMRMIMGGVFLLTYGKKMLKGVTPKRRRRRRSRR